jgi:probable HAF family extracellular repeat protein
MRTTSTFATAVFLFCVIPALTVAQIYTVTDLGSLTPTGINSWAQVVGNYNGHAFIWTRNQGMRDLGTLMGGTFSWAAAINDLGVVTGTADGAGTVVGIDSIFDYRGTNVECSDLIQPFVWNRHMQGLGSVGPASDSFILLSDWCSYPFYGTAINNRGQVAGFTDQLPNDFQWGFLWSAGAPMSLFGSSIPYTFATGISNTGQIVGENGESLFGSATYWRNAAATPLAKLSDLRSAANGVNDRGQIVGWSYISDSSDDVHAVRWTQSGTIRDLGTLPGDSVSSATKINFFGLIIGSSGNTVDVFTTVIGGLGNSFDTGPLEVIGRPFIWSEHDGMRDLNTLIRRNSGWVLHSATDINVWGQIVGEGTLRGQAHGFLLTPRNPFKF